MTVWIYLIIIICAILFAFLYKKEPFENTINHCKNVCRGMDHICSKKCLYTNMSYGYGTYPEAGYTPMINNVIR